MKRKPSERITLQQFADLLGLSYVRTKVIARANAERLDKRVAEHVAGRPASLDRAACVRFAAERGGGDEHERTPSPKPEAKHDRRHPLHP